VKEVQKDIQTAKDIVDDIRNFSWTLGFIGQINDEVIKHIFDNPDYTNSYLNVAAWLYYDRGTCFLQDADNLVMKTHDLVELLKVLRDKLPRITRVTTYTMSRTIARKSDGALKELKQAGLDRINVGLESGYDPILKSMKKGVTSVQHIEAGRKVMEADMELSENVMPGLGGQDLWKEHAVETARVLNRINPHFIRIRSLRVPERIPLFNKIEDGEFNMQNDDMLVAEIKLFVEELDGINSIIVSDHTMNLLEEIDGKLPEDKEKILGIIKKYQELPDSERLLYRVGKRIGAYRSTDDLKHDPKTYGKVMNLTRNLKARGGPEMVERFITGIADQYV